MNRQPSQLHCFVPSLVIHAFYGWVVRGEGVRGGDQQQEGMITLIARSVWLRSFLALALAPASRHIPPTVFYLCFHRQNPRC